MALKIFSLRAFIDTFQVSGSISTKSTSASHTLKQFAEATKEFGEVHPKSPFLIPRAIQDICNAAVALDTALANLTLQIDLILFSNSST